MGVGLMMQARYRWGVVLALLLVLGWGGWMLWSPALMSPAMTEQRESSYQVDVVAEYHLGFSYSELNPATWVVAISESHDRLVTFDVVRFQWLIYDLSGNLLHSFGESGEGPGQSLVPKGVEISPSGEIVVADWSQEHISWFSGEGRLIGVSPKVQGVSGWTDIAVVGEEILATPRPTHAFRNGDHGIYRLTHSEATALTKETAGPITIDSDGNIYVLNIRLTGGEPGEVLREEHYVTSFTQQGELRFSRKLPTDSSKMSFAYWPALDRLVAVDGGWVELITVDGQFMETLLPALNPGDEVIAALPGQDNLWVVYRTGTVRALAVTPVPPQEGAR